MNYQTGRSVPIVLSVPMNYQTGRSVPIVLSVPMNDQTRLYAAVVLSVPMTYQTGRSAPIVLSVPMNYQTGLYADVVLSVKLSNISISVFWPVHLFVRLVVCLLAHRFVCLVVILFVCPVARTFVRLNVWLKFATFLPVCVFCLFATFPVVLFPHTCIPLDRRHLMENGPLDRRHLMENGPLYTVTWWKMVHFTPSPDGKWSTLRRQLKKNSPLYTVTWWKMVHFRELSSYSRTASHGTHSVFQLFPFEPVASNQPAVNYLVCAASLFRASHHWRHFDVALLTYFTDRKRAGEREGAGSMS